MNLGIINKCPFHKFNTFMKTTKVTDGARHNCHHTSVRTVVHDASQDYKTYCGQRKTRSKMQFSRSALQYSMIWLPICMSRLFPHCQIIYYELGLALSLKDPTNQRWVNCNTGFCPTAMPPQVKQNPSLPVLF